MMTEEHLEKRSGEGNVNADFRFNWRKMETAAQELYGDNKSMAYAPL